jgi:high-affinity iron transporter
MAVLGGFSMGVVMLVILSGVIFYSSIRLSLKLFFGLASATLALLAVVLAGKGIGALQEAGVVPLDPVAFPTVPALGIYPNWQGLALQGLVLLLIVSGLLYQYFSSRQITAGNP